MQIFRLLISDFDSELRSIDVSWIGRKFQWTREDASTGAVDRMHDYLIALADNTRKPITTCLRLAAKHAFPDASIEVMNPTQIAQADEVPVPATVLAASGVAAQ